MAVITISRQIGAGGWILGQRSSKRLGYRYVNEGMILEVAKKAIIQRENWYFYESIKFQKQWKDILNNF